MKEILKKIHAWIFRKKIARAAAAAKAAENKESAKQILKEYRHTLVSTKIYVSRNQMQFFFDENGERCKPMNPNVFFTCAAASLQDAKKKFNQFVERENWLYLLTKIK